MIKRLLLFLVLVFGSYPLLAQSNTVSGTVTDAADGSPLPGVNVLVQGTTSGTQTDFDGNYSIEAEEGNTLVFSYLGMSTQNVTVGSSSEMNVALIEDASQLDEVVVTALGVERQKKSLTYATQGIDAEGIDEARPQQNLVNSLQGKVAGLSIQTSGNGVSGGSKVVLRGNRSIAGSSQVLYIVDGVPLGGDISDISPDDVASINVLKGANAAALYGARANNGAIIITTKSGNEGGMSIIVSSTITAQKGNIQYDYQNEYGQGSAGIYNPNSTGSWGPALDGSTVAGWQPLGATSYSFSPQADNVKDFMQTGFNLANNLSIRSGNEKIKTFFGYTHELRNGIVADNDLKRHNLTFKIDNNLIKDKLVLSAKANYIRTDLFNSLDTGESFSNPWRHAYRLPRNIRTEDAENYKYIDAIGNVRQNYWKVGDNGGANPYWTINENLKEIISNRIIGYTSLKYNFTDNLNLMIRTSLDQRSEAREDKLSNDSYIIADNGNYSTRNQTNYEWNTDFLLGYTKEINENFGFNLNFGGNNRQTKYQWVRTDNGGLNAANIFAVTNALNLTATQEFTTKEVNSLYGFGQAAFKDALFLDLTYRSDWSSTLPAENRRFDYYSAGISAVISDLVALPEAISYLKLRTSYAEVGNDTDPYNISRNANLVAGGFVQLQTTQPNENLKPERTKSFEFGVDARFLDNRLGIDFTYYKSNSIDQLFRQTALVESGISTKFINGGDVQNKGIEFILTGTPVRTSDFNWDVTVNYSKNTSEVLSLSDGLDELSYGGDFFRQFKLVVGDPWGNVYSRGFARNDAGQVLVASDGTPEVTSGQDVLVANYNPDWLGGITNSFRYKNLSFSFLIDMRQGGQVGSVTNAILASDGALQSTVAGRDGSLVFGTNVFPELDVVQADGSANNISVNSEQFWAKIGGRNSPVGEAFVEDASNIRMREMSLGYSLPQSLLGNGPFKSAKVSLVGRNLFFIKNNASFDPEVLINTNTNADGFESFSPPSTSSLGVNVKFAF
ncbi:SusC/RagA family TonB-linked outer membrane protein [Aurantibacter crassamenti]|uniref:SusC/RagA family TonB-linked outer membrane protein n=1 Tax=Aurantibacter crassamenti TaxID=1837375 RepID=UPI0019399CF1|nr:SusC/RagA family TonB-linked outer membrane protein [Aurantibacter crassamenti]MBM1106857.1 SusC/RagA family TonB-linked outer membrane protein [Aurantibacter crassamenti]